MNILIIGGGTVGKITAEYFSKEGHTVTVVEHELSRIRSLQEQLDIAIVEGRGTDHNALKAANLEQTQLFLALTDSDEVNIIACTFAKFAGVPRKIARISDAGFLGTDNTLSLRELGVDEMLNTSQTLIQEISDIVALPGMTDVKRYLHDSIAVATFAFGKESPWYGKPLGGLTFPFDVIPLGVEQIGKFEPYDTDLVVNEFLYATFACESSRLAELHRVIAPNAVVIDKIMIFGGGYKSRTTGGELATALKATGVKHIELVDEDPENASRLSAKYDCPVIVDDPARPSFATDGNLQKVDMFIGLSGNFEKNLYACSAAYREGVRYTVAMVRYPEHTAFVSAVPLTAFLNPAIVTANKIMKYHQADRIISRTIVQYNRAECLEILVSSNSPLVGRTVASLPFKKSRCVAILRNQKLIHVTDTTVFQAMDQVLFLLINGEVSSFRPFL